MVEAYADNCGGVAGQPTGVTFGSGDSDGYGYDANTGRQTGFQANVGGANPLLSGTLSWNANASLGQLTLNYNGGTETCNYSHDDLSRIASVSCNPGSTFLQTLTYDAFGNIAKNGTYNWLPTYNQSTNQIGGIAGVAYDANGNLLNDSSHSYTWDGNWGNPANIDSGVVALTYDALGRMVEQNRERGYTQIVYSPSGAKLALMNGQSLQEAFVPLPGGGTAVYNSGGLAYYRHPDWLGSSRLATTTSRTVYAYTGYAPFGESYEGQGSTDLSFTGQNQDTVSGLNDFLYREYSPAQGRWISPDPAGSAAVDPTNPQTWNRYAYVGNSPLELTDAQGLFMDGTTSPLWAFFPYVGCMNLMVDGIDVGNYFCYNLALQTGGAGAGAGYYVQLVSDCKQDSGSREPTYQLMKGGQQSAAYYIQEQVDTSYKPGFWLGLWHSLIGNGSIQTGGQNNVKAGVYPDRVSIPNGATLSQTFWISKNRINSTSLAPDSTQVPIVAPLANGTVGVLPAQTITNQNGTVFIRGTVATAKCKTSDISF